MKDVRKLNTIGQSKTYYLTVPRWMIEELKWKKGQRIAVELKGKTVVLRDYEPKKKSK